MHKLIMVSELKSEQFGPYESPKAARDARARLVSETQYLADPWLYGDVVSV